MIKEMYPPIPATLPAPITGKFNIALTNTKFQVLADEASKLVFNEDNLDAIKAFIDKTKLVEKAIETTHKDGKAEALKIGRDWDSAKNAFLSQVSAIVEVPAKKYTSLCLEIQERQQKEKKEEDRKKNIKTGIENNAVDFAKRIANCTTTKELTSIESVINLEKSRKEKYAEFLPEAVERFNELNSILKTQKENVKELELLAKQKEEAEKSGDDQAIMDIEVKQEQAIQKVEESKVEVQEKAIEQSMATHIPEARPVYIAIKARRSVWKWKVVDIKETAKKMPSWVVMSPVDEKIDEYLKGKKAEGISGEDPFIVAGVEFYLDKTF